MKRFSDFAKEPVALEGDKIKLDDLVNREVVITGFNVKKSQYGKNISGKYLTLQVRVDDATKICFTGSDVLIGQIEKYQDEIPFVATIRKINRYYTLS